MSYAVIEAGAVTTIQLHADFDTNNTLAGNESVLKGGYERACIVSYNSHTQEEITLRSVSHTWILNLDVYIPWRGMASTLEANIAVERQKVIDQIEQYPKLNGTAGVISAEITNADRPEVLTPRKSVYRGHRLFLRVLEIVTPSRQE